MQKYLCEVYIYKYEIKNKNIKFNFFNSTSQDFWSNFYNYFFEDWKIDICDKFMNEQDIYKRLNFFYYLIIWKNNKIYEKLKKEFDNTFHKLKILEILLLMI